MVKSIKKYILDNHMIDPGQHVIIGVSGGADSVCLFFLLRQLQEEMQIKLSVVHINHMLRETAERDEEFVRDLCKSWEVPCYIIREPVGEIAKERKISVEEAGREVRYAAFEAVRKQVHGDRIAIAHNLNDQVETVLFHLFRGCGVSGLKGIKPVRDRLIRPLLGTQRSEIEAYIAKNKIKHIVDETNLENIYTRNAIRNRVLPIIEETVSGATVKHIGETACMVNEADDFLQLQTRSAFARIAKVYHVGEFAYVYIQAERLKREHIFLQKGIALMAVERLSLSRKDISSIHIKKILQLLDMQVGKKVNLPYGLLAQRSYDAIIIRKEDEEIYIPDGPDMEMPTGPREISIPGRTVLSEEKELETRVFPFEKGMKVPQKPYTKWFDYDKIEKSLIVRNREEGDYFFLDEIRKKTVKSYMINEKIEKDRRDSKILITEGNHVLWIMGHRISNFYKVDENTRNVLEITMEVKQFLTEREQKL